MVAVESVDRGSVRIGESTGKMVYRLLVVLDAFDARNTRDTSEDFDTFVFGM